MSVILAFDLGGTSLRAGLIDAGGRILAQAADPAGLAGRSLPGGGAEVAPEAIWAGVLRLADRLDRAHPGLGRAAAVAVTGATRTQVLLDAQGRACGPALGFADTRGGALMDEIRARLPATHPETAQINPYHPLARLFWLARTGRLPAGARAVEPKDYVNARLTGRVASDRISSARLLAAAGLAEALGLPASLVPEALDPLDILGPVRPGLPGPLGRLAGRPVLAMAHDTWAAVLGLGALRPGLAYNLSGTTEVFGVLAAAPASAEGLMSVTWGAQAEQLGGPSLCGGDTLAWALALLAAGGDVAAAIERLLAPPAHPQPLLFLPYLRGERVPWWDPALRGALLGLAREHGPGDVLRAVLEGVALLNRTVLARAEAATRAQVAEIRFGGGGAASPAWAQIKADICNRPVAVTACAEPGLLGGAIAARTALGEVASLAAGQEAMVAIARRHLPDPQRAAQAARLHELFLAAHAALAPISADLAALAPPAAAPPAPPDPGPDGQGIAASGAGPTGPAPTDPARTTPAAVNPAASGPVPTGPDRTGPARTGPVQTGPAQTGPAQIGPAASGAAPVGPDRTNPAAPGPVASNPAASNPAALGRARTEPAAPGPARTDIPARERPACRCAS